jgi:RNA polymerase sigma-70 factor (ECF subfamily)
MTGDSTAEGLLSRVAEHDAAALAELYDRFAPGLLGLAQRIVADRRQAAEVVETTFLKLWSDACRVARPEASVAVWLAFTARAAALEKRRGAKGRARAARRRETAVEKSCDWLPRPEEVERLEARRPLLKVLLAQLPKSQREAVELAMFEGLTESEIAAKVGEPLGKVQSGLRAAVHFLRHRLRAVLGTWSAEI